LRFRKIQKNWRIKSFEKLSVADTDKLVKSAPRAKKARSHAQKTIDSATVFDMENKIKSALGVGVKISQRRGGAGQVVLSFVSRPQLMELVEKLAK